MNAIEDLFHIHTSKKKYEGYEGLNLVLNLSVFFKSVQWASNSLFSTGFKHWMCCSQARSCWTCTYPYHWQKQLWRYFFCHVNPHTTSRHTSWVYSDKYWPAQYPLAVMGSFCSFVTVWSINIFPKRHLKDRLKLIELYENNVNFIIQSILKTF